MKRVVVVLFMVSLLLFGGCQANDLDPNGSSMPSKEQEVDNASDLESSVFTPYLLQITIPGTLIYDGPGYDYSVVGSISESGIYTIVDEAWQRAGNTVTIWGKLKSGLGWINLNEVEGSAIENNASYILPYSSERLLTDQDVRFLSEEQLMLARNEIYARHGRIFQDAQIREYFEAQPWYHGTITPENFSESLLNEVEKSNIAFIQEYESNLHGEGNVSPEDPDDNGTYEPGHPSGPEHSSQPMEAEPEDPSTPEVTTKEVHGVTFRYVSSYYQKAEYADGVIDYNFSFEIEYCRPEDYMSDHDQIIGIYRSNGLYEKEEIGSLYKSAGSDDFAVFQVTVKGDFQDSYFGYKNIEYRKYTSDGILLKNAAGITDYELYLIDKNAGSSVEGTVEETFYMGFFTSEVGSVDFKILDVGPNGLGEW